VRHKLLIQGWSFISLEIVFFFVSEKKKALTKLMLKYICHSTSLLYGFDWIVDLKIAIRPNAVLCLGEIFYAPF
jgi:hypothetical protein